MHSLPEKYTITHNRNDFSRIRFSLQYPVSAMKNDNFLTDKMQEVKVVVKYIPTGFSAEVDRPSRRHVHKVFAKSFRCLEHKDVAFLQIEA